MISRSFTGLALAALLALPAAAEAQSRRSSGTQIGGLVGFELGDLDGFALRLDGQVDLQRLAPQFMLSGVGSLQFSHLSDEDGGMEWTANIFELIPAARFTYEATRDVGIYGDLGLGLYIGHFNVDFGAFGDEDDSDAGLSMRFGGGAYFEISPSVRLTGELAFHPHFGDYDETTFSLMVGASFALR